MEAQCLATLSKTLKSGTTSAWEFFSDNDNTFYAENNMGKHIACKDIDDLRRFYKKMISWGFMPTDISTEEDE